MLSPSQYLTPDRGRGGGAAGLRDGVLSPRGPQQLFGLGPGGDPGLRGGGGLLRQDMTSMIRPEFTSTPATNTQSPPLLQDRYSSPMAGGFSSPIQGAYNNTGDPAQLQGGASWSSRTDLALNSFNSIWQKCEDLKFILENCSIKELSVIWHTIVDRMFMLGGGRGWDICSISRSQSPRDYTAISSFLSSSGPLLSAANKLLADPYIRYEFPVSRLSPNLVHQISSCSPSLSSFISSRLSHNMQQLSLNSFEFYMFTFSVYIVLPYSTDNKLVAGESVYPFILEDYLSYYLPCDGTTPPSLPFHLSVPTGSPSHVQTPAEHPGQSSSTPARKSLLRNPASAAVVSPSSPSVTASRTPASSSSSTTSSDQIWRSETLLSIFSNVWLTQFSSRPSSPGTGLTSGDLSIAVSDTLKIVRMLIKHLHYFANSGGHHDVTPLDQLKRATLPGVKQQMYSLFKYIFTHWPHDTSFRLVLETWLSFIQPWRYTDRARGSQDTEPVAVNGARWQLWVAEYILFYSEMLRLLLPRFFRMDLTATRNAYMLFRISKVFNQPGVSGLIQNAEVGLDRGKGQTMPSLLDNDTMTVDHDREMVLSAARQCLMELEGHSNKYSPVFGNEFRQTVVELLGVADRAKEALGDMLTEMGDRKVTEEGMGTVTSWLSWIFGSVGDNEDNVEKEEMKKSMTHLNSAMTSLGEVFSVSPAVSPGKSGDGCSRRQGVGSPHSPEMVETDNGLVLTPHGRWQVVQGLVRPVVRYEGDPDTRPITQEEVVWLVRMFHQLSASLNIQYGDYLSTVYNGNDIRGQVARMVLSPPTNYYTVKKSISGGPNTRQLHHHRARLSLRWVANKKTLIYMTAYILLMWMFGYSTFGAVLVLLSVTSLGLLATAGLRQATQPRPSLLDTSDINLDSPGSSSDKKIK